MSLEVHTDGLSTGIVFEGTPKAFTPYENGIIVTMDIHGKTQDVKIALKENQSLVLQAGDIDDSYKEFDYTLYANAGSDILASDNGCAYMLHDINGLLTERLIPLGDCSDLFAHAKAIIEGLKALPAGASVKVFTPNHIIVEQMGRKRDHKDPTWIELCEQAAKFNIKFVHAVSSNVQMNDTHMSKILHVGRQAAIASFEKVRSHDEIRAEVMDEIETASTTRYVMYTDGSSHGNPGPAGCGAVILENNKIISGKSFAIGEATNIRAEISAVINGLLCIPAHIPVDIMTDSELVVRTMEGKYRKKKNLDLWIKLDEVLKGRTVTFTWVRGHNKHATGLTDEQQNDAHWNDLADKFANEGAEESANTAKVYHEQY